MSSYIQWIQKEHQQFIPLPSIPPCSKPSTATDPSKESQKPKKSGDQESGMEGFPDDGAFMEMIQKGLDVLQAMDGHSVDSGRNGKSASISVSSLSSIHEDASIPSFTSSAAPSFVPSMSWSA